MVAISISAASAGSHIRLHARAAIAAVGLWSCLVLGGGTKAGFLADTAIQLLAAALLAGLLAFPQSQSTPAHRWALRSAFVVVGLLVLTLAAQLVPLPPEIWLNLPGRQRWAEVFQMAGQAGTWRPLSLAPELTLLALLSLLPPIVVFWATATSSVRSRRVLVASVVLFAAFSAMLGLAQVAQGEASGLRPFEVTNRGDAVGLFANRNHLSCLLYAALLLTFPWAAVASADLMQATQSKRGLPTAVLLSALFAFTLIFILMSGQAITRSRAGMGLTAMALVGGILLTRGAQGGEKLRGARVAIAAVMLALVFALQFTLYRNLERFDSDPFADARVPYAQNTLTAALALFPFGAGVGSFIEVYGSFERLQDLHVTYANRAHNDFLEGLLELGLPGFVVFVTFIAWYLRRAVAAWIGSGAGSTAPLDRMIVRASALAIALIIAHSFVDYPMRTGAISAIFALCCGLLVPPPVPFNEGEQERPAARAPAKARTSTRPAPPTIPRPEPAFAREKTPFHFPEPAMTPPPLPQNPTAPGERGTRWGDDMQWPEEWRTRQPASPIPSDNRDKTSWEEQVRKLQSTPPIKKDN